MARPDKVASVAEVKEKLEGSVGAVLTDYRGLKVHELAELRSNLRKSGVEYKVYKNTLTKIAIKDIGLDGLSEFLEGPTAIAFSADDPVVAARLLNDFSKDHENLKLKAGIVEGEILDATGIKAVASLPSREELLAKLVGMLQSPISNFVYMLNGPISSLAAVLGRIKESKPSQ